MTEQEKLDALPAQLQLLFAGMNSREIAAALVKSMPTESAMDVYWALHACLPICVTTACDGRDVIEQIKQMNANDPELQHYVPTLDEIKAVMPFVLFESQDSDLMDQIIDALPAKGDEKKWISLSK